jgi:hypothetical protein
MGKNSGFKAAKAARYASAAGGGTGGGDGEEDGYRPGTSVDGMVRHSFSCAGGRGQALKSKRVAPGCANSLLAVRKVVCRRM